MGGIRRVILVNIKNQTHLSFFGFSNRKTQIYPCNRYYDNQFSTMASKPINISAGLEPALSQLIMYSIVFQKCFHDKIHKN